MYKVIVAHPHQQHSYHLAEALNEKGILFSYITTVYNKKNSYTEKIISILKGDLQQRAKKRRCDKIPDDKVIQIGEILGLIFLLLMRIFHNDKRIMNPINRIIGNYFGKKVAKYAIKNNVDMVIGYDSECSKLFSILKEKAPNIIRIMDVSAANRLYLRDVYLKDFEKCPEFAERLKREKCELFSKIANKEMQLLKKEIEDTNYFIVPSEFVKNSLYFSGVSDEQILYCNYGVELKEFPLKNYNNINTPLKFVYVGGVKELKGIGYLLKAFKNISDKKAKLIVVGAKDNGKDIEVYKNVTYTGHIIHSKVEKILKNSDVFIFPSLGDSFSLACLEAAAVGLPLIVSENTGMIDKMHDGIEGFIIPIQSVVEIENKINWFINNPEKIEIMGKKAREMAITYTWEKYKKEISNILYNILRR